MSISSSQLSHLRRAAKFLESNGIRATRYASGAGTRGGLIETLLNAFLGNRRLQQRSLGGLSDVDLARQLLESQGYTISPRGRLRDVGGRTGGTGSGRQTQTAPGGSGTGGRSPRNRLTQPPEPPQPPRTRGLERIGGRRAPAGAPPLPGEESPQMEEILTPQSSNVFSFAYDPYTSTLFVTYQAHALNPDSVSTGRGRQGGRSQLRGKLGKTVGGKTGERGPMYSYLDVPARVYQRMRLASSKGKFVWDELRIRGTIYGHKYRYQLVQGQVTTQGGISGVYIPRKATRQGFRTRSVADIGSGRRGFESSTLPAQRGFSTRKPRGL